MFGNSEDTYNPSANQFREAAIVRDNTNFLLFCVWKIEEE